MDFFLELTAVYPSWECQNAVDTFERMYRRWLEMGDYRVIYCDQTDCGMSRCIAKFSSDHDLSTESGIHTIRSFSPFRADKRLYHAPVLVSMIPVVDDPDSSQVYKVVLRRAGGLLVGCSSEVTVSDGQRKITMAGERSQKENKDLAISYLASVARYTPVSDKIRFYSVNTIPYVKDFRSNVTHRDVANILNGDLNRFFEKA